MWQRKEMAVAMAVAMVFGWAPAGWAEVVVGEEVMADGAVVLPADTIPPGEVSDSQAEVIFQENLLEAMEDMPGGPSLDVVEAAKNPPPIVSDPAVAKVMEDPVVAASDPAEAEAVDLLEAGEQQPQQATAQNPAAPGLIRVSAPGTAPQGAIDIVVTYLQPPQSGNNGTLSPQQLREAYRLVRLSPPGTAPQWAIDMVEAYLQSPQSGNNGTLSPQQLEEARRMIRAHTLYRSIYGNSPPPQTGLTPSEWQLRLEWERREYRRRQINEVQEQLNRIQQRLLELRRASDRIYGGRRGVGPQR